MTRVWYASTLFGALSLAAASTAGLLGERDERRLLIVASTVPAPEAAAPLDSLAQFDVLRPHVDEIVRWNDVIAPLHPAHWQPPAGEWPLWSRLVTERLGLADGISELVVESLAVAPAATLAALLPDCPVTVYSDGLMSYGPTRSALLPELGGRVTRLLHLDLAEGLAPLLLREWDVEPVTLPAAEFTAAIAALGEPEPGPAAGAPVIVGQYLAQLGLLSDAEELELHRDMLRGLAARGHDRVVFRPHPAAAQGHEPALRAEATRLGVTLDVPGDGLPVEAWFAAARPLLVVSCFSTALFTAARYYGCDVASVGAELLLDRLTPFENSNRIPATLVRALVPALSADGTLTPPPDVDTARLVEAVGYCMQPTRLPELRDAAVAHLAAHGTGEYFKRRRLQSLDLVAPTRRAVTSPTLRRTARRLLDRVRPG